MKKLTPFLSLVVLFVGAASIFQEITGSYPYLGDNSPDPFEDSFTLSWVLWALQMDAYTFAAMHVQIRGL